MFKKIKEFCKEAVSNIMVSNGMDINSLADIGTFEIRGAIAEAILVGIVALLYFGFGLTVLSALVLNYTILNGITIIIGTDELAYDALKEYDKILERNREELKKIKEKLF